VSPVIWPIGMGVDFRGSLDVRDGRMIGTDGVAAAGAAPGIDKVLADESLHADRN
jgi:hypothetical protein